MKNYKMNEFKITRPAYMPPKTSYPIRVWLGDKDIFPIAPNVNAKHSESQRLKAFELPSISFKSRNLTGCVSIINLGRHFFVVIGVFFY